MQDDMVTLSQDNKHQILLQKLTGFQSEKFDHETNAQILEAQIKVAKTDEKAEFANQLAVTNRAIEMLVVTIMETNKQIAAVLGVEGLQNNVVLSQEEKNQKLMQRILQFEAKKFHLVTSEQVLQKQLLENTTDEETKEINSQIVIAKRTVELLDIAIQVVRSLIVETPTVEVKS